MPKIKIVSVLLVPLTIALLAYLVWMFLSYESIPNSMSLQKARKYIYDYVVVGGGTAGCVLANRLSANENVTVLLIEAGTTFGPLALVPLLATQMQKTSVDWQFKSTPQSFSSEGLVEGVNCFNCHSTPERSENDSFSGQVQLLPRGKGLGGSSQLNYMLHFDHIEWDIDGWKRDGLISWGFAELERFLQKDDEGKCGRNTGV